MGPLYPHMQRQPPRACQKGPRCTHEPPAGQPTGARASGNSSRKGQAPSLLQFGGPLHCFWPLGKGEVTPSHITSGGDPKCLIRCSPEPLRTPALRSQPRLGFPSRAKGSVWVLKEQDKAKLSGPFLPPIPTHPQWLPGLVWSV